MKIFYAIQATGNGHISRAKTLLPYLKDLGEVDIMLSGSNSSLNIDAPVKYRSNGLSLFYNCSGGIDYYQMIRGLNPVNLRQQIRDLPVEKYDLIINDFEYITAAACKRKNLPSIQFGHQASFISPRTPRPPKRNSIGEWILKNYAPATDYIGLHFDRYDDFIFPPVIKDEILNADPLDKNFITVYLPSFCEPQLIKIFSQFRDFRFEIFSGQTTAAKTEGNIEFIPVDRNTFNKSLINCSGIITGGGFETPAEALFLGKKLMCIPIRAQYEQQCNAAALSQLGVMCTERIDEYFSDFFYNWIDKPAIIMNYRNRITEMLERVMSTLLVSV